MSRFLVLLAALTAALLLAACSPAEEVDGEEVAADETEATETETSDAEETATDDPSPDETATDGATAEETTESPSPAASPDDGGATETATEGGAGGGTTGTTGGQGTTGGGSGDDEGEEPGQAFPPVPAGEPDPCLLTEAQVQSVVGQQLTMLGPSGDSAAFRLCTYGEPSDPGSIDLALVSLEAHSEEQGSEISGEDFVTDWIQQARELDAEEVQEVDAMGEGSAVRITHDDFSSEAWAYVGDFAYGVTAMGFDDNDAHAMSLLELILDEAAS